VAPYFEARLREDLPTRADGVMARIRRSKGGVLNKSAFGDRFRGEGEEWGVTRALFRLWRDRLGYTDWPEEPAGTTFRRPGRGVQTRLFG
ncbi:MAG: radical SAM protein, partial [Myxococcota bacterium]